MLSNEECKLIGSFNPIHGTSKEVAEHYAINDIYCDPDERALLKPLCDKGYVFYGGNDFYWHLTKAGLAEWKTYNSELPYPNKSCW